jgi:hypothetical protein
MRRVFALGYQTEASVQCAKVGSAGPIGASRQGGGLQFFALSESCGQCGGLLHGMPRGQIVHGAQLCALGDGADS